MTLKNYLESRPSLTACEALLNYSLALKDVLSNWTISRLVLIQPQARTGGAFPACKTLCDAHCTQPSQAILVFWLVRTNSTDQDLGEGGQWGPKFVKKHKI